MTKTAFITGINGQDGSYLAELLLARGYTVHGLIRRSSSINTWRLDGIYESPQTAERLFLHYGDVTDAGCIMRIVLDAEPDEIYNLAAQSHVRVSFDCPSSTLDSITHGTLNVLEAARRLKAHKLVKVYQASSSEMFGNSPAPQSESTTFAPVSPYGCAKLAAHHLAKTYRDAYSMHISCGILFNHESPRRGETFVTRKIAIGVARIAAGKQRELYLGNLDARRDWGFAGDYVVAMANMLQQDDPGDYVVGTGESRSVRDFVSAACEHCGIDMDRIKHDARYERPIEVNELRADPTRANAVLKWDARGSFGRLVWTMISSEMRRQRVWSRHAVEEATDVAGSRKAS